MTNSIKSLIKRILPTSLLRWRARRLNRKVYEPYVGLSPQEVFSKIYAEKEWGAAGDDFSSGSGTRNERVSGSYISAITSELSALPAPPSVVDLGCGDFSVGSRIRPLCARYIACDIVPELIERNRNRYARMDVEFRCLDISDQPLPEADICFLRQVLQHLDNDQISRIAVKLSRYSSVVVTEHLPLSRFAPNSEKPTGAGIRLWQFPQSGVVLTAAPFNLIVKSERVICEAEEQGGVVRTMWYEI